MRDLTALGGYTVLSLITVLAITYLLMKGKRASALLVGVAVIGGTALSNLLKLGFDRPRPDIVAHLVDVHSLSFPSGHAMLSAATYLTLGALLARSERGIVMRSYFIGVAIVLTMLIGASRVYLGVHYPTDVLADGAPGRPGRFCAGGLPAGCSGAAASSPAPETTTAPVLFGPGAVFQAGLRLRSRSC